MRADAGIAGDDFENARDLGRGDGEETDPDLQHAKHHQRLGRPAPEPLAVLLIVRRRTPDADHLPDRQRSHEQPDHAERDQPDQRLRFTLPIDDKAKAADGDTGDQPDDRSVHPVGQRQRQLATPVPREIILPSLRRQWRRERGRRRK